jgi:transposase
MEKNKKQVPKSYDKEYKSEAVKLAGQIGAKRASVELGVPHGTVASWLTAARKGTIDTGVGSQTPSSALTQAEEIRRLREENKALNKENKRLRETNEFLEEASAFFAASRQKLAKKSDSNT